MSEISKEQMLERLEMVRAECRGNYGDGFDCGACKFDAECDAIHALIESGVPAAQDAVPDVSDDVIFIEHIRGHLSAGQEVICKICRKTAKQIIEEVRYGK